VKELGTHILVCEVFGEKLNFRKFFKFQVMKPLDVKTKFYNAEVNKLLIHKNHSYMAYLSSGQIYFPFQIKIAKKLPCLK